jgi:hypothetical protein
MRCCRLGRTGSCPSPPGTSTTVAHILTKQIMEVTMWIFLGSGRGRNWRSLSHTHTPSPPNSIVSHFIRYCADLNFIYVMSTPIWFSLIFLLSVHMISITGPYRTEFVLQFIRGTIFYAISTPIFYAISTPIFYASTIIWFPLFCIVISAHDGHRNMVYRFLLN